MQLEQCLRRGTAIVWVTVSLTFASALAGSQNTNLPNFQKVDERVYRGAQPTDDGFKDLASLGIKTVVDLRLIGEHSQADEEKIVKALGMRYVSIPMKGMSTPKDDQIKAVLALFNDANPVFVHCRRGADRTGTVIAAYRISHDGWANGKALTEAKSYGMSFFEQAMQRYVMAYKPSDLSLGISASSGATPVQGASR